jgi:hypothetical protein
MMFPVKGFSAALDTQLVQIPMEADSAIFTLNAKIYKPKGDGTFPLIILTYATTRTEAPENFTKYAVDTYYTVMRLVIL